MTAALSKRAQRILRNGGALITCQYDNCGKQFAQARDLLNHTQMVHVKPQHPEAQAKKAQKKAARKNRMPRQGNLDLTSNNLANDRTIVIVDFLTPHDKIACSLCGLFAAMPLTGRCLSCDPILLNFAKEEAEREARRNSTPPSATGSMSPVCYDWDDETLQAFAHGHMGFPCA